MKKLISSIVLCLSLMSFNSTNLNYNNIENLNSDTQQKINKKINNNNFNSVFNYIDLSNDIRIIKIFDSPNAYAYLTLSFYSTPFTEYSSLYVLQTVMEVTPGYVAYMNGHDNYNEDKYLKNGYLHIIPTSYSNVDTDERTSDINGFYGLPASSESTFTLNSAFSSTLTLNNGFETGISTDDGLFFKYNGGSSLTLSYSKSSLVTSPEPKLSGQKDPEFPKLDGFFTKYSFEWSYEYQGKGDNTYSLTTYTIFEVNNSSHIIDSNGEVHTSSFFYLNLEASCTTTNSNEDLDIPIQGYKQLEI